RCERAVKRMSQMVGRSHSTPSLNAQLLNCSYSADDQRRPEGSILGHTGRLSSTEPLAVLTEGITLVPSRLIRRLLKGGTRGPGSCGPLFPYKIFFLAFRP